MGIGVESAPGNTDSTNGAPDTGDTRFARKLLGIVNGFNGDGVFGEDLSFVIDVRLNRSVGISVSIGQIDRDADGASGANSGCSNCLDRIRTISRLILFCSNKEAIGVNNRVFSHISCHGGVNGRLCFCSSSRRANRTNSGGDE